MQKKQNSKRYFQLETTENVANLTIYGDITSFPWMESDVSAFNLSKQLADLQGVDKINVYVNSYGGEVSEGLAIYNALKRHKAKVTTYCDGMACSIASVIFMAGDERVMCNPSFLMIHDAWTRAEGNAAELRKQADDLDIITQASVAAYMEHIDITEEELREKMKAETWLTQDDALDMGFATSIEGASESDKPAQSARKRVFEMIADIIAAEQAEDEEEDDETDDGAEAAETPEEASDAEGEEEPTEEPEDAENDDSEPQDAPDDESDEEPDDEEEENDENEDDPEAAQLWSGIFNAIFRE